MVRIIVWLGLAFVVAILGLAMWATAESLPAGSGPTVAFVAVPKTLGPGLPACFDPPTCRYRLTGVDVHLRAPGGLLFATLHAGGHEADAVRVSLPTHWAWAVQSESCWWLRALRAWAIAVPEVVGPALLAQLPSKPAVCEAVVSRLLVPCAGPDGGTRRECVDAATFACRDGGSRYHPTIVYGGGRASSTPSDAAVPDAGSRAASPVDPAWAVSPDAATHKTCSAVPVGTACPR